MLPYTTGDEFTARVVETIIMLGDKPIYVAGLGERSLKYYELPISDEGRTPTQTVKWNDPALNANNFRLGYMNVEPRSGFNTAYVTRMPARITKQGLAQQNIFIPPSSGLSFSRALYVRGLADMLVGRYPRMSDAVSTVKSGDLHLCAFARRWAIEFDKLEVFHLNYRGRRIATGFEPGVFKLPQHALHLREMIEALQLRVV